MKTLKYLFIAVFLITLNIGLVQAQEKVKLKVLCYNLRFGELASLEEFAEFIKKENPDIVALQEVDVNTYRERAPKQNGKNFISELAYRTNMLSVYAKTILYKGGYYGIGILSKYPLISTERILLPMPEGAKEQRALLIAEVEIPEKGQFTFSCTHLDYTTYDVRSTQINFVNETLLKKEGPVMLCGDFNSKSDSKEITEGMNRWTQVCSPNPTIPSNAPKSKIDYIFCYPGTSWIKVEASTPVIPLSDHLPLISTVELIIKK